MTIKFTPRLTAPSASDKDYIHYSYGGYNYCIRIKGNSVLPNCVGYVWGRWREILGKSPKLSKGNANTFWSFKDGYERTQFPRLGSVICWDGGQYGHVGIVEQYDQATGKITASMSAYGGQRFYLYELTPPYTYKERFKLQGFIHLPGSKPLPKAGTPVETKITHIPSSFTFTEAGKTKALKPEIIGTAKPTYSTSDPKVVTVSKTGVMTAVAPGKATVAVKAGDVKKTVAVTVPKFKSLIEVTEPIHKAAVAQAEWMKGFTYKWKGAGAQTIKASKTYGTCVTYANCVLYRLGILKEKSYIYQDDKGNVTYNGATAALRQSCKERAEKYLVIKRVNNVRPVKLKDELKRGDILMYTRGTIKAGPGSHICIFSGEWDGDKAIVWDNNWAEHGMKKKSTFDKPLDSYIRIHRFKVSTECENGTITLSNNYLANETVTIRYKSDKPVRKITVDGKAVDASKYPTEYTFRNLKKDHKIRVLFS